MHAGDPAVHAVTVCTAETLALAVRLGASFVAHHRGVATIHVRGDAPERPAPEVDRVEITGTPPGAPDDATTLVPWALSNALDHGRGPVVALAPTTFVVRALTPLTDAAGRAGLAVVPRVLAPDDGERPLDPTAVLAAGVVEPGLVACTEAASTRLVLRWWKHAIGVGAGERAVDLLPAFGAAVVRDPGLGVSRWNLAERPVRDSPYGPFAADSALRTYDLAGLQADLPPRWEDDGAPAPELDDHTATLAWQHIVTMGQRR